MTQDKESIKKIAKFNSIFLTLNNKGQDAALIVLKSLDFAQSVFSENIIEQSSSPVSGLTDENMATVQEKNKHKQQK